MIIERALGIHFENIEALVEHIQQNPQIKSLDISDSRIGDEGVKHLAEGLQDTGVISLTTLKLNDKAINSLAQTQIIILPLLIS